MARVNRIKAAYQHGTGDLGFSRLLADKDPISKAHLICALYGEIEACQARIGDMLGLELQQPDVIDILKQLYQQLFNLSAFCYFKGQKIEFEFDPILFKTIEDQATTLQQELGDCADFLVFEAPVQPRALNWIRLSVRKIEHLYWCWRESVEVDQYLKLHPASETAVYSQGAFLNRLSTWMFYVSRQEIRLLHQREQYWERHLSYAPEP